MTNQNLEIAKPQIEDADGEYQSFSTSMPLVCGYYWYWCPFTNDFVVVEAVLRNGKMKLKRNDCIQGYIDEGGFIHSKITKPSTNGCAVKRSNQACLDSKEYVTVAIQKR